MTKHYYRPHNSPCIKEIAVDICLEMGACQEADITLSHFDSFLPRTAEEMEWTRECFVCRQMAISIERTLRITKHITESSAIRIVRESCDRLGFGSSSKELSICKEIIINELEEIAMEARFHNEAALREERSVLTFPAVLCLKINACKPYLDEEDRWKQELQKVEQVFY